MIRALGRLFRDPPPAWAFELSEQAVAAVHLGKPPRLAYQALRPGVLALSPLRDNVMEPEELAAAIAALAGPRESRKRHEAVLILPDASARVMVLDFENFPATSAEQLSLVRFRIKKGLPFDLDSAALSYAVQPAGGKRVDVVVAVSPLEIIARYEAALRACGLVPGLVTTSTLAALELVREGGLVMLAKLSGRFFTISLVQAGRLKLLRWIELSETSGDEILPPLHATAAYAEDQLGARVEKLLVCGFDGAAGIQPLLERELGLAPQPLLSRYGQVEAHNAGLLGWLESLGEEGTR